MNANNVYLLEKFLTAAVNQQYVRVNTTNNEYEASIILRIQTLVKKATHFSNTLYYK